MKLVVAITHDEDSGDLVEDLVGQDYMVTKLASTGGFLKSGNTTLLIGTTVEKVDDVFEMIKKNCKTRKDIITTSAILGEAGSFASMPLEITIGGATVFVLDVETFFKC
jgi:uncharacterized protein YaaQ